MVDWFFSGASRSVGCWWILTVALPASANREGEEETCPVVQFSVLLLVCCLCRVLVIDYYLLVPLLLYGLTFCCKLLYVSSLSFASEFVLHWSLSVVRLLSLVIPEGKKNFALPCTVCIVCWYSS